MIPLLLLVLAADPLAPILAQMDANAATFKSVKTGLKQVNHNAAVDVDNTSTGTMVLRRPAPHDVRALVTFVEPAPKQVSIGNGVAQLYNPKLKIIDEYKLDGKTQLGFEQFYLLAFGGSGKELAANYDISYVGSETLGAVKTSHLQLVPKNADVKKKFKAIDLWLTEGQAVPAQLKLSQPGGDTITFIYTDVKLNPKLSDGDLKLHTEKGVVIQHPGQ